MRSRRTLAAAVLAVLVTATGAGASGAQAADPTVVLDRTGTAVGEAMLVSGGGWSAGSTVIVELCGQGGLGGSSDCDVPNQSVAGVGQSGRFSVELKVGHLPSPCPCVVKVTDQASHVAATAAIAVAGVPTVPISGASDGPERSVEVSEISLSGGRWPELFGAGGSRLLELTLVNTGAVSVAPKVNIAWGPGADPSGFVSPPGVEPMEPGDTQTISVSLDQGPLSIGERTAVVEIQGVTAEPIVTRTSSTSYPWGLLAMALVLLQVLLLRVRNRLRHRVAARTPEPLTVTEPALSAPSSTPRAALPPSPPLVIDLTATDTHDVPAPPEGSPAEVLAIQLQARLALKQVNDRADELVASAASALERIEVTARQRILEAEVQCAHEVEVLRAARARADALLEAAPARLDAVRHQVEAEQESARRSLAEAEQTAARLRVDAEREVERILRNIEVHLSPTSSSSAAAPRHRAAPRIDDLDQRLAGAVQRALSSMSSDSSS